MLNLETLRSGYLNLFSEIVSGFAVALPVSQSFQSHMLLKSHDRFIIVNFTLFFLQACLPFSQKTKINLS